MQCQKYNLDIFMHSSLIMSSTSRKLSKTEDSSRWLSSPKVGKYSHKTFDINYHIKYMNSEQYKLSKKSRFLFSMVTLCIIFYYKFLYNYYLAYMESPHYDGDLRCSMLYIFKPLSVNPIKWSNTFIPFVGDRRRTVWVCLTILWGWCLNG